MSLSQAQFGSISASQIQVNGSNVSLEGHTHSSIDITDFTSAVIGVGTSVFASTSHAHEELSGITVSSIDKEAATFSTVTASVGNFATLSVSDAHFSMATVSANSVTVNGTPVSLSGHVHGMSDVVGLDSYIQTFAAYESRIAALEGQLQGLEQALHQINTGSSASS